MCLEDGLKSITIHGVDEQLASRLKELAESEGTSMNRTVKRLLEQALGMKPRAPQHNREQFEQFLGVWSEEERSEFEHATAELEQVLDSDWS